MLVGWVGGGFFVERFLWKECVGLGVLGWVIGGLGMVGGKGLVVLVRGWCWVCVWCGGWLVGVCFGGRWLVVLFVVEWLVCVVFRICRIILIWYYDV